MTLITLEIVLGIDKVIFISLIADRRPERLDCVLPNAEEDAELIVRWFPRASLTTFISGIPLQIEMTLATIQAAARQSLDAGFAGTGR